MKRWFSYFKNQLPIAIFGTILTGSVVLIELTQPKLMALIVDTGIPTKNVGLILNTGIKMGLLALAGATLGVGSVICAAIASNNFAKRLRHEVVNRIQTFSSAEMDHLTTSSLITRCTNDINFIQSTVLQSLRMLVRAPMMLVTAVIMAYLTNKTMSVAIFGAVLLLTVLLYLLLTKGYPLFVVMQTALDHVNRSLQEGLINIRVIKSFVREKHEDTRFSITNEELMQASRKANSLMALLNPTMMLVLNGSTLVVMAYGAHLILNTQTLKIGELIVFINYMAFTLNSMMMLSMTLTMFSRSKASFQRINQIFLTNSEIADKLTVSDEQVTKGKLEFTNVSFRYNPESAVADLEQLNFTVEAGQKIGIIGSTGSGKTTLLKLVVRLLNLKEGDIRIDDRSIDTYSLNALRRSIGVVPQKNILFSGTIAENLRWGNPLATDEELWQALESSSIASFVKSQPLGLESRVEQGGNNFSGGQKQRLCIARALVIKPKILILDDSTSAVDGATENKIKETFNTKYQNTTILMIAQKISSVKDADRILVLDNGRVVGFDDHEHLLESNVIYREIVASQSGRGDLSGQ